MKKICTAILLLALCLCLCSCKSSDYGKAVEQFDAGQFQLAREAFVALGDYEDSAAMVTACDYQIAVELMEDKKYEEALAQFLVLGDYEDSVSRSISCVCAIANAHIENGDMAKAVSLLAEYYDHPEAEDLLIRILCDEGTVYADYVSKSITNWNEYLLVWMKEVKAVANRTKAGKSIDIPPVDQSAPQVVSIKRDMEKAAECIARIREAFSEDVLKVCDEDVQNVVTTMLESSETIGKQFENLDNWAVSTLFYGIQMNNAGKANNALMNALNSVLDAVETMQANHS